MNAELPVNINKTEFLAWVQTRERKRYELVNGSVVKAEQNTRGHARVTGNLLFARDRRLDRKRWDVLQSFGLETGPLTIRDPDVLVDRGGAGGDLTANAPVLLAEVLSPSSVTADLGDKLAEYLGIPSLLAYLVFSQDEPKAWAWVRNESGFAAGAEIIVGEDGCIHISALSTDLPLSAIYAGITSSENRN